MWLRVFILLYSSSQIFGQIVIDKTWNGAATNGEMAVLAARTNGEIERCEWKKVPEDSRSDVEIYSSVSSNSRDPVRVELAERDTLCKLIFEDVEDDNKGIWEVTVYGDCKETNFRSRRKRDASDRHRRQINLPPVAVDPVDDANRQVKFPDQVQVAHQGGVQGILGLNQPKIKNTRNEIQRTRFKTSAARRRTSSSLTAPPECNVRDRAGGIELKIGRDDRDIVVIAGQQVVQGQVGKEVILTARSSIEPKNCIVKRGRDTIVDLEDRNNCNNQVERSHRVCVEKYNSRPDGIWACNAKIDKMDEDLDGEWSIEVEGDRSGESAEFEVIAFELPRKVLLLDERDDEIKSRDSIEPDRDGFRVKCAVEGGLSQPRLKLYAGNEVIPAKEETCREEDYCTEFIFPVLKHYDGKEVTCVAHYQGVNSLEEREAQVTAGELTVDRDFACTLPDSGNNDITVCALDKRSRDDVDMEIKFECSPEPDEVTWRMQILRGREEEFEAGERADRYDSFDWEEDGRDTWVLSMTLEADENDLDVPNNHQIEIRNDGGTVIYNITIATKDCDGDSESGSTREGDRQCRKGDRDCVCLDRDNYCCSTSCRSGDYCCETCRKGDRDCECTTVDRRERCYTVKDVRDDDRDDDRDEGDEECRDGDRDCVCLDRGNYCCSTSCRSGDYCCDTCRKGDRDCECTTVDRRERCYTVKDVKDKDTTETCRDGDRDCKCFDDFDFCCKEDCRTDGCCIRCDKGDKNCVCPRGERYCYEKVQSSPATDIEVKAKNIMIDSCLKMSATLLEYWEPDGNRRSGSASDREVQDQLEDHLETIKCTRFDDDLQDYVKDPDLRRDRVKTSPLEVEEVENSPRLTNEKDYTSFISSLNQGDNKVKKVQNALQIDPDILDQAADIIAKNEELTNKK